MTNEHENQESWLAQTPTWLHLLVGIMSLAGALILFLMQTERRFTIIEERQAFILRHQQEASTATESFRNDMIRRLELLSTQVTVMTLEFAKHQARYEAGNGGVGLRAPKGDPRHQ